MIYPCGPACTDPLQGAVGLAAQPRGTENITLTNLAAGPIDLEGHAIKTGAYSYHFGQATLLNPGETLRLDVGGAPERTSRSSITGASPIRSCTTPVASCAWSATPT